MSQNIQNKGKRVAKAIADAGFCSRRDAELLIADGRVQVNGKFINTPATFITDHSIKIDGKLLQTKQPTRLFILHKPKGAISSNKDPQGRATIFDLLPKGLPRLLSVGRLDFNTEGLLLLTTNGELSRYIELPKTGWIRKYRVRAHGPLNFDRIKKLEKGITIDGVRYGSIKITVDDTQNSTNKWLSVSLTEGKNREIRKVMAELGLEVNRLIRTSFGPFNLNDLKSGQIIEIPKKQLKNYIKPEFLN